MLRSNIHLIGNKSLETPNVCTVLRHRAQFFSTHPPSHRRPPLQLKMSWMDSWSRPSKSQATPAPFYLLPGGESTPYCHSCGRVISTRRTAATAKTDTPVKYCSSRCRTQKPGKLDRELERAFVHFLSGDKDGATEAKQATKSAPGKHKKAKHSKGDNRILVSCSTVEEHVFGPHRSSIEEPETHPEAEAETANISASLPTGPLLSTSSEDDADLLENPQNDAHTDGDVLARMAIRSGTRIRPPQAVSEVNGSVGGEKGRAERIQETDEMLEKRREGQKRAKEREMTKCAARRGVVFGFTVDNVDDPKRLCEAVMAGKVVEPSFAKGDWAIRWRE
ncbi:hypothetical protein FDECE_10635 [Fusarium decemcellulare]|nr:hypothetical protein FDECE_10635 [Fusarium decemcellulare]